MLYLVSARHQCGVASCRQFGIESRSLKACYELLEVCMQDILAAPHSQNMKFCSSLRWASLLSLQAGFTNIVHLEGGISRWRYEGNTTEPSK